MGVTWTQYLFAIVLVCLFEALTAAAQVTLSNLLVENKVAPVGIDVKPRFSWIVNSAQREVIQTSYQILVSKSQAGSSDVWNSGVVSSKKPYLIEYTGPALLSDTGYFWRVNVATTAGSSSASSEFTTGFLSAADWNPSVWIGKPATGLNIPEALSSQFRAASWIWTGETGAPNAPAADRAFRKTFTSPSEKIATSALILMTVDDRFTLFVNGNLVGSSPSSQDIWKSSQRFSVSLNAGSNLFAVRATNLADVNSGGDTPAGLLAAIQITFSDGTTTIVTSDNSWRSIKTIPTNFQSPILDDSSWAAATILAAYGSGPWGTGVALPSGEVTPTITLTESTWIWSSESSAPLAPAQPRAFRKTFPTPSGKTLKTAFVLLTVDDGFTLYINGAVVGSSPNQIDVWKSAQQFTIPLSDSSSTVFAVHATNLPDVQNGGPSPAGLLAAIQVGFTDGTSTIILSDATWKVNKDIPSGFELPSTDDSLWSAATSLGRYGASPWTNQVSVSDSLGEHPAPLLRKEFLVTKTISFARLYYAVGGYASITLNGVPASDHVLTPGFTKYDKQTEYVVLDVASKLKAGGNAIGVELGRSHYAVTQGSVWSWNNAPWRAEPTLRIVLSVGYSDGTTSRVVTDGTWQAIEGPTRLDDVFGGENYDGDWVSPETNPAGGNAPEDSRVSATAYLYKMLTTMNQIALVLAKTADAGTFSSQAANVKIAFNDAFLSKTAGHYVGISGDSGYRQTHNLLALAFDLAPNSTAAQLAADSISRDVVSRGNHLNTGALGTKYILPVLTDYKHGDTAFAVAQQTTFPSWGFWITNGANSMWEHWALESRSRDHLFLGTFEDWLYKHLAGIQLSSTAFETASIAPVLTEHLAWARAWTVTPFGNLTVDWERITGNIRIDVGVPVGVDATVTIPASSVKDVLEGGKSLSSADISVLGTDGHNVRVSLGSGKYSFTVAK